MSCGLVQNKRPYRAMKDRLLGSCVDNILKILHEFTEFVPTFLSEFTKFGENVVFVELLQNPFPDLRRNWLLFRNWPSCRRFNWLLKLGLIHAWHAFRTVRTISKVLFFHWSVAFLKKSCRGR